MTWILLILAAVYVIIGFVLVAKGGWADTFMINCKLFFTCVLGWPYMLFYDWWVNREIRSRVTTIIDDEEQ